MTTVMIVSAAANMIWQFNKRNIEILIAMGHRVVVATNFKDPGTIDNSEVEIMKNWLIQHNVDFHQIDFKRGLGSVRNNHISIKQLRTVIREERVDVIHSQSPIGGVLARIAGLLEHKINVYTAHGFHFFKGAPIRYWLIFYPVEYLLSFITDVLIVINNEDYKRSQHMHARMVEKIHGVGVDVSGALKVSQKFREQQRVALRHQLGLSPDDFMILNIGELSVRKNQSMIIRALAKLNNSKIHLFIAGIGPEKVNLLSLARSFGLDEQVHFLGYRNDIRDLHYAADINVFPSKQEGLALGGLESVIDGLYILGADVRGIRDYILNSEIGRTYQLDDDNGLAEMISQAVINKPRVSSRQVKTLLKYDQKNVDLEMTALYKKILNGNEPKQI